MVGVEFRIVRLLLLLVQCDERLVLSKKNVSQLLYGMLLLVCLLSANLSETTSK
jgi:hypothetical protein